MNPFLTFIVKVLALALITACIDQFISSFKADFVEALGEFIVAFAIVESSILLFRKLRGKAN